MLSRKLFSTGNSALPPSPPELVWSLGDQAAYESITTIPIPAGVLQPGDVLFTTSSADSSPPATPSGFTKLAPLIQPSAWYMNANLCCMTVEAIPPTDITGLSAVTTTTHTAFAFRNIVAPVSALFRDDYYNRAFEADGTTRIYRPYPPAPHDVSPVTGPVGGLALYIGALDDDRLFMSPPSPFTPCGRSYTTTKGASIAASYSIIPSAGITLGRFTGGSDNWISMFATAQAT